MASDEWIKTILSKLKKNSLFSIFIGKTVINIYVDTDKGDTTGIDTSLASEEQAIKDKAADKQSSSAPISETSTPKQPSSGLIENTRINTAGSAPGSMKRLQDALKKIIAENGKVILNDHQKTKAYLDDYTGDEYRDEIKLLSWLLEHNVHKEIVQSKEFDAQAQSEYVQQTAKKYFAPKDKAGEAVIELLFTVFYDCDLIKRRENVADTTDIDDPPPEGGSDGANPSSFVTITICYIIGSIIACIFIGVIVCVFIGIIGAYVDVIKGDNNIDKIGPVILTKFDGIISHIKTSLAAYIICIITLGSTIGGLFAAQTQNKKDNNTK